MEDADMQNIIDREVRYVHMHVNTTHCLCFIVCVHMGLRLPSLYWTNKETHPWIYLYLSLRPVSDLSLS